MKRRGFAFEIQLERLSKHLNSIGVHMHKNHARRTVGGVYIEGEPFDYEILCDGAIHCFDAKECEGARWSLKNAKPHQLNNLLICSKNGAEAYFLVLFKPDRLVRFSADLVQMALSSGKKSLAPEEGVTWDWKEFDISRKRSAS